MRKQYIKKYLENNVARNKAFNRNGVRFALPFSIKCDHCKEFSAKNTRYNAMKEILKDRLDCGVEIYRFILKCKKCGGIHTLVTDPEHGMYKAEHGCQNAESIN